MNDFREYSNYLMHYNSKSNKRGRNSGNSNGSEKTDWFTSVVNEAQRVGNKAEEAGNKLLEMINRGDYVGAYNYYKNLDGETKRVIERRIMNHELPEIIGNGNEREGKKVLEQFNNNVEIFLSTFRPKTEMTTSINVNNHVRDITGRRRRR